MDGVEVDPKLVDLAMKYFYLDELYETYRLHESDRLQIIISDGEEYLLHCNKRYDAIFNDAYHGSTSDAGLLKEQGVRAIKKSLKHDGVYALNLITALSGSLSMRGVMAEATLKQHFRNVHVFPCTTGRKPDENQNCVIVATDLELF